MSLYADSYTIEAYITAGWEDITDDVISDISGGWGVTGNTAVDLMADTGTLAFVLNNQNDEYIPGHTSSLAGWNKNTPIRLTITFEGEAHVYRFYVSALGVTSEKFSSKFVQLACVDWMDYAAKYPLISPSIQTDKRADEAITTIVSGMPIAPQAESYEIGQETFLTVFDATTPKTKAYSEISKNVFSELGYFYVQKDKVNGETLRFEDRHYRNGLRTLDQIPTTTGDALLLETGDFLLLETGDKLLLNTVGAASFSNSMTSLQIEYGQDVVNHFTAVAYPKGRSAANEVLFTLESPIEIGRGQTLIFRTNYSDPTGGNQINAVSSTMVAPVATTDYLMNTQSDGGGTNQTASLGITATYGTEGIVYQLVNSYAGTAYVTFLQARGIGVTQYSPIRDEAESTISQNAYGYQSQGIEQRYQQTPALGLLRGSAIVEEEKEPRLDLQKISFIANRSANLMHAFLSIDCGCLVYIKEDDSEIDGYYYIQGIEFTIEMGGVIRFSWIVRGMNSILSGGLTPVAIEFTGTDSHEGINFGIAPYVETEKARTFCAWVYFDVDTGLQTVIHNSSNNNGVGFWSQLGKLRFTAFKSTGAGQWTANAAHATGSWIHVGVTYDQSSDPLSDPIIYINGSAVAITENTAPSGSYVSTPGVPLSIGALFTTDSGTGDPLVTWELNGKIADARVYKRILTSAEMTTLYNAGDPDASLVTDSDLIFQAPCVKTKDYSGLLDATLAATDKLTDNLFGIVGTPEGGEILRVFP